jgi:hypothetical protein
MSQPFRLQLLTIAILAGFAQHGAWAADAYLCEGGRIVKVPFGKLEEMKRSDPCVAAHYGLKVSAASAPAATPSSIETGTLSGSPVPGAGVERTEPPVEATETRAGRGSSPRAERKFQQRMAEKPSPPLATPGTDYRNVVLLNPQAGAPTIYRHER